MTNTTFVTSKWLDDDIPNLNNYIPQVNDIVIYIFQAHEEFITKYYDVIKFKSDNEIFPFEKLVDLLSENICRIDSITYEFPLLPKKSSKFPANIVMNLTLSLLNDQNKIFNVRYFKPETADLEFLIPLKKYEEAVIAAKTLVKNSQVFITLNNEKKMVFISEVKTNKLRLHINMIT